MVKKMYSKQQLNHFLGIAKDAALLSAEILTKRNNKLRSVHKNLRRDIKIAADKESENIIIDYLIKKAPFSILSEEKGVIEMPQSPKGVKWIIDPLDGTLNFFRKIPVCCVSIGLWQEDEPLLGVVYDFNNSQLFSAIRKGGAWLNGSKIKTSNIRSKKDAILLTGFPNKTDFSRKTISGFVSNIRNFKKIRLLGSAALSLAYVASAKADAYYEKDIKAWDIAAGAALVLAAGGKLYMKRTLENNTFTVFAANRFLKITHQDKS